MMWIPSGAAWEGHTDASRELAQDISSALMACGLTEKAAAIEMGIHPTDLSRQLAGRDPLNLWRLTSLSAEFWLVFLHKRAARIGGALVTPEQLALIKGAAAIGPRMLSTVLSVDQKERKRA